ncbi:hypothetical protein [Eubacterium sp.]|uniref:hypothetical protein n=1 Tax=Eubacterium sp. TaxID=142586 RepID=UPI003F0D8F98
MKNWVVYSECTPSEITYSAGKIVLQNGLVCREIETQGCKTVSFFNYQKELELIDAPRGDFELFVNKKNYCTDAFDFLEYRLVPCEERVPFKKSATMTYAGVYPPAGKAVELCYDGKELPLSVTVRYEIYDGMPVVMKRITVKSNSEGEITVDNITTDVMCISQNRDTIFVDSDYNSTTQFLGLELSKYAKNYARFRYDYLEVAPLYRMNVKLFQGEELSSICAYELLFANDYYEHRLIEVKEMYRRIAPWCTDNVLFFHLISNNSRTIRKAVDQCNEIGLEMIIQSFGSGVKMESSNEHYLNRIKNAYDYGHSKGLRMGAYTLAYVKNYRPVKGDEALNHDGSHICRCLACDWAEQYMKNVIRFIDKTGADAVEIDGPYGMLMCSGGKTHHHDDFTDSQYKQWKRSVVDWYQELKKRNIYINAPDWHFLNGINRCGVGYEEIAFSEKRAEQLITSRIYYYKGTFDKNPSQGWGFLPLNVYHGGGKDAMFFPTEQNAFEFDWALAQLTAAGVWPTIRGRKVYDSETGKEIFKKWVTVFKKYREVLNGITVHFMPPRIDTEKPDRTTCIDAIMNQLPYGENRGFVMFFNQTDSERTEEITLPVYYTGLTDLSEPPAPFENTKNSDVSYPLYGEEIAPLVIKARDGSSRTYITDEKVIDKPIPPLPAGEPTQNQICISKEDTAPENYTIDTNGNVKMKITLPPMSYQWYVLKKPEKERE